MTTRLEHFQKSVDESCRRMLRDIASHTSELMKSLPEIAGEALPNPTQPPGTLLQRRALEWFEKTHKAGDLRIIEPQFSMPGGLDFWLWGAKSATGRDTRPQKRRQLIAALVRSRYLVHVDTPTIEFWCMQGAMRRIRAQDANKGAPVAPAEPAEVDMNIPDREDDL